MIHVLQRLLHVGPRPALTPAPERAAAAARTEEDLRRAVEQRRQAQILAEQIRERRRVNGFAEAMIQLWEGHQ